MRGVVQSAPEIEQKDQVIIFFTEIAKLSGEQEESVSLLESSLPFNLQPVLNNSTIARIKWIGQGKPEFQILFIKLLLIVFHHIFDPFARIHRD